MTGRLEPAGDGREDALLASPTIQNHAAFLSLLPSGVLLCAWFGGTLEGKSDISIYLSLLEPGAERWSEPVRVSDDPDRSEQNPVVFQEPSGVLSLIHTAQVSGNQDECILRRRCLAPAGRRWTGSHDTAGVAASVDEGRSWTLSEVPGSIGSVHMTIVPLD